MPWFTHTQIDNNYITLFRYQLFWQEKLTIYLPLNYITSGRDYSNDYSIAQLSVDCCLDRHWNHVPRPMILIIVRHPNKTPFRVRTRHLSCLMYIQRSRF